MIEQAVKSALERITGLEVYPLLLPDAEQEGATFQRISDPAVGDGLTRTELTAVRMQVSLYLIDDYTRLLQLDAAIWSEWQTIVQGELDGHPVQYISRGGIQQSKTTLTGGRTQYRLVRDFTLTVPE
jgi:hypothetical protein